MRLWIGPIFSACVILFSSEAGSRITGIDLQKAIEGAGAIAIARPTAVWVQNDNHGPGWGGCAKLKIVELLKGHLKDGVIYCWTGATDTYNLASTGNEYIIFTRPKPLGDRALALQQSTSLSGERVRLIRDGSGPCIRAIGIGSKGFVKLPPGTKTIDTSRFCDDSQTRRPARTSGQRLSIVELRRVIAKIVGTPAALETR